MKAAFGILALYVSIPLAIVAVQSVVVRPAEQPSAALHASIATPTPSAAVLAPR